MLNAGLIYTNDRCIGCNKCISVCPVSSANQVVINKQTGNNVIKVNGDRCIVCGYCIDECKHGAREYRDDTKTFFKDLVRGESISLLVAPSFAVNNADNYENVLGYLKHLGVKHIYNVSFGADIATWAYIEYIKENNVEGMISSACPSIVKYIELYMPSVIDKIIPIYSPLMCTAIYIKKYIKNTDRLAFLSPCIAKKNEMLYSGTKDLVEYNITFEKINHSIEDVDISLYYGENELTYGLGSIYPIPGGLTKNIEYLNGFKNVINQVEGEKIVYPYLRRYEDVIKSEENIPYLLDVLNCENGCINGPAVSEKMKDEAIFEIHKLKEQAYSREKISEKSTHEERYKKKKEFFSQLKLKDFIRMFDKNKSIHDKELDKMEIDSIFESMLKYTTEDRKIDCSLCGYKTCLDMAKSVANGINNRDNCIFYAKEKMHKENEQVQNLLDKISIMNRELIESTQLKSNFLANMSHEIRTPMNAVIGMAEMALKGNLEKREKEYVNQIKSSGKNLLAIINDILDFSKIESGKMEIVETEYDMRSMVYDIINIINMRAYEKSLYIDIDIDPNLPNIVYGDDIRIRQMIINLANNAIKFTNEGIVTICIGFDDYEEHIKLKVSVKDTGIGIKDEDLEKLFVSFQQLDSKRNRNVEGTGLGLAITNMLVQLMGGEIKVDSKYGEGTEFSFWIPQIAKSEEKIAVIDNKDIVVMEMLTNSYLKKSLHDIVSSLGAIYYEYASNIYEIEGRKHIDFLFVEPEIYTEELKKVYKDTKIIVIAGMNCDKLNENVTILKIPINCISVAAVLNNEELVYGDSFEDEQIKFEAPGANVLIVDDNVVNLTVVQGLLEPFKMNIVTATSGKQAIEMVANNKYDIIFMDHMMPDMDGIETTKNIRAMDGEYYKNIPIVALTANAMSGIKSLFIQEGMNDFVAKPIELRNIILVLKKWLPANKIKNGVIHKDKKTEQNIEDAVEGVLKFEIKGLDIATGMMYLNDKKLYLKVLRDYYKEIENKSNIIEEYQKNKEIEKYTVEVHALKSSSKIIGAIELSELAEKLEMAGHNKDIDTIDKETGKLLKIYRNFIEVFEPIIQENEMNEKELIIARNEDIREKLERVMYSCEDFDFNEASRMLNELMKYALDEECEHMLKEISENVEILEFDESIRLTKKWLEALEI